MQIFSAVGDNRQKQQTENKNVLNVFDVVALNANNNNKHIYICNTNISLAQLSPTKTPKKKTENKISADEKLKAKQIADSSQSSVLRKCNATK